MFLGRLLCLGIWELSEDRLLCRHKRTQAFKLKGWVKCEEEKNCCERTLQKSVGTGTDNNSTGTRTDSTGGTDIGNFVFDIFLQKYLLISFFSNEEDFN